MVNKRLTFEYEQKKRDFLRLLRDDGEMTVWMMMEKLDVTLHRAKLGRFAHVNSINANPPS